MNIVNSLNHSKWECKIMWHGDPRAVGSHYMVSFEFTLEKHFMIILGKENARFWRSLYNQIMFI